RFWFEGVYVDWELPPRGHRAEFIEEFGPGLSQPIWREVLDIRASSPVAVTVLHTREGRAHASLPAAGTGH
ncbi:MAG: hypothetical protein WAO20_00115, partial [Acidobacteriota bacterium]